MSIGQRLKDVRKQMGLTQVELAQKANISRSYLGDVEADRYNPSIDTLKDLAKALNVPVTRLIASPDSSAPGAAFDELDYAFMGAYRDLNENDKKMLLEMARRLQEKNQQ